MIEWSEGFELPAGESLVVDERLIVAPCSGRFIPEYSQDPGGEYVKKGQIIGQILSSNGDQVPVFSGFAGLMVGYLIPHGAPVRSSEAVMWLRQMPSPTLPHGNP
ncbi:MAG: hypothetical protein ACT4OM_05095 [Actinomycetota bacterium]